MEEEEKWWSPTHLSEEEEVFEEKIPPNEPPSESIESEKIDSLEEETSSVIEEVYTQQENPAQFEEKGFLGFSWLTKVEAIVFLVVLIIAVSNIVLGLVLMPDDPVYEENEAVVLASYAGYDIYQAESCDDYGCDYWTEIECWADIDLYHVVDSVNYTTESNGWRVYNEMYYRGGEFDCISIVENETFIPGTVVQIFYNVDNPEEVYDYPPDGIGFITFISGICCFGLLPFIFLYIRFNANKQSVSYGSTAAGSNETVVHHHHHHHGAYISRPWLRRGTTRVGTRTSRRRSEGGRSGRGRR